MLIAVPGGPSHGHALAGNMCVDNTIAWYLQHGTLPLRKPHARWDKTCQPLPTGARDIRPGKASSQQVQPRTKPARAISLNIL